MLKTSGSRRKPCQNPDNISVSMEVPQITATGSNNEVSYKIDCFGCNRFCSFSFVFRKKLPYAFVGKLAGVFSSRCNALAELDTPTEDLVGQLSLISPVGEVTPCHGEE